MKDVAALARVGTKTVSRVINAEPNVSAATAERVWSAVRALDYHVDLQAGSLRRASGRTRTLGLLLSSIDNPFASAISRAVEDAALPREVSVFASSLDDDAQREEAAVGAFLRRRVDGLILTTMSRSAAYLLPTIQRGTPVVFVDREPVGIDADVVTSDNRAGARRAARHLAAHGHRRIVALIDRLDIQTATERRDGFVEGLTSADSVRATIIDGLHDSEGAERALGELLAGEDPPTAVFGGQNLITVGALRALRARGLQRSVALVGFDDVPLGDLLEPGVTVIRQHPQRIGAIAADRVFARIDGDDSAPVRIVVPTELIARGSGEIIAPR
ncbi:LacI family DNA-binding transcriptional regulator [Microbacterium dextranolyticum]|uniref:LacI family transcriptional regulator n=2 Tax=Microbacterium dextranolyticum TaxID=36806 RepID=A0A9W6HLG1_9MICO|nr:LacI family transcriptional regulator [Microbacterium dextranolyticum]